MGLCVNQGVYVVSVVANSPAEEAGLKAGGSNADGTLVAGGDVIAAVDGKSVASVDDLSAYLNTKNVGDKVNLTVLRNGQSITIQVTLAAWPTNLSSSASPRIPTTTPIFPRNGRGQQGSGNGN